MKEDFVAYDVRTEKGLDSRVFILATKWNTYTFFWIPKLNRRNILCRSEAVVAILLYPRCDRKEVATPLLSSLPSRWTRRRKLSCLIWVLWRICYVTYNAVFYWRFAVECRAETCSLKVLEKYLIADVEAGVDCILGKGIKRPVAFINCYGHRYFSSTSAVVLFFVVCPSQFWVYKNIFLPRYNTFSFSEILITTPHADLTSSGMHKKSSTGCIGLYNSILL